MQRNHIIMIVGALCFSFTAAGAEAQANPELGDVGGSFQNDGQTQGTWQPPTGQMGDSSDMDEPEEVSSSSSGSSDHSAVVGTFGVGFFGFVEVPVGCGGNLAPGAGACAPESIAAPTLGVRYWLKEKLAVEAALGLGIQSGGSEARAGGTVTEINDPSYTAIALHGAVPLALAHSGHFVFELIPELNFGLGFGSLDVGGNSIDFSGMLFQLGARVGGEVHFGFIGVPQLALQGTVGLHLSVSSTSSELTTPAGTSELSGSNFRFGTSVQGEPWDIFTGAIAAIYYF